MLNFAKNKDVELFFNNISNAEIKALKEYLLDVYTNFHPKQGLSVVFDITHWCNLSCRGCATNSRLLQNYEKIPDILLDLTYKDIVLILNQIKSYLKKVPQLPFYLNYGGGEPFLRTDILEILKYSCNLFGKESISIDTNGTVISVDIANAISLYVGNLGVSLDGLEDRNNYWRRPPIGFNAYQKVFNFLKTACKHENLASIIEVTFVATKSSIKEIPLLIEKLSAIGVRRFSVHRAMPVGRFLQIKEEIPDNFDYLKLFSELVKQRNRTGMSIHCHHTIESIYAALLLNIDTYKNTDVVCNPDKRSSLGIDPHGFVYFDPWCTEEPWSLLRKGPIINSHMTFEDCFNDDDSVFTFAKLKSSKINRCNGCLTDCSGGSRIAAASNFLANSNTLNTDIILKSLEEIDPACPLYC